MRAPRPHLRSLLRLLALVLWCVAAPSLHAGLELAGWAAGEACCADDCEETGAPCTQQCARCVPSTHVVSMHEAVATVRRHDTPLPRGDAPRRVPTQGHHEPPFKPPPV